MPKAGGGCLVMKSSKNDPSHSLVSFANTPLKRRNSMFYFLVPIAIVAGLGFIVDRRRRASAYYDKPTHPDAKPGDSSNYTMGDNRYTSGGE